MKEAPARIRNLQEALRSPVLDKPFVYYVTDLASLRGFWSYISSASKSRNIKAYNFCKRLNKELREKPNETS